MGYTRRKMKTSRRVKRTKAKNTRKQRQLRNRAFRKSRRVNRGGSDPVKSSGMSESKMEDERIEKENAQRDALDNEKDEEIEKKRVANIKSGLYRRPLVKDSKSIIVDQTKRLANTENQRKFMDELDAEEVPGDKEGGPIWFAGKKKRAIKKKRTA